MIAQPQWTTKAWGRTRDCGNGIHEIDVVKGGFCSVHMHQHHGNQFFIVSGRLSVEFCERPGPILKCETGTVRIVVLDNESGTAPCSISIPAGVWHRFVALTPVRAMEVYRQEQSAAAEDIVRASEGGVIDG